MWSVVPQENDGEDQGEAVRDRGKTGTGVRGVRGIGEGTGKEIGWCKEGPGKEVEVVWACDEDCRQQSV